MSGLDSLAVHAVVSAKDALKKPSGELSYLEHGPALPSCAKCGTYVEKLSWYTDQYRCERVYEAHCHGATEIVHVSEQLHYAYENGMQMGEAFAGTKALPEAAQ